MSSYLIIHWDRMGIAVRGQDRTGLQDTGNGLVLTLNGRRVYRGTQQNLLRRGWATRASRDLSQSAAVGTLRS